jgi:hypothetical protein
MIAWMMAHAELILAVLLGLSETLALIFPASSGVGGILAAVISVLKKLGAKKAE